MAYHLLLTSLCLRVAGSAEIRSLKHPLVGAVRTQGWPWVVFKVIPIKICKLDVHSLVENLGEEPCN